MIVSPLVAYSHASRIGNTCESQPYLRLVQSHDFSADDVDREFIDCRVQSDINRHLEWIGNKALRNCGSIAILRALECGTLESRLLRIFELILFRLVGRVFSAD